MAFDEPEQLFTHRTRVYITSLIYVAYAVLGLVGLSVVAAADNGTNVRFGSVVSLLVPGLHFLVSILGAFTAAGRAAARVEPQIVVALGDWLQAAALGAASVAVDIGGLEGAKPSVIIASCACVAVAQLSCAIKTIILLDGEKYDQVSGEALQTL